MHSWLLPGMIALIATTCLVQADAEMLLQAVDYKGCKKFQSDQTAHKTSVDVEVRSQSDYNYKPNSLRQQKVRGSYGRYIRFVGTTLNEYAGTPARCNPGMPDTKV